MVRHYVESLPRRALNRGWIPHPLAEEQERLTGEDSYGAPPRREPTSARTQPEMDSPPVGRRTRAADGGGFLRCATTSRACLGAHSAGDGFPARWQKNKSG